MQKLIFILSILLSQLAVAANSHSKQSCRLLDNEQARSYCYDTAYKTTPLTKSKLAKGEKLIETYRCGKRLLNLDMTKEEVIKLCPLHKKPSNIEHYLQSFETHHRGHYDHHYVSFETNKMEKWTFKQYGRFRTYLVFREGVLYQIIQNSSIRN